MLAWRERTDNLVPAGLVVTGPAMRTLLAVLRRRCHDEVHAETRNEARTEVCADVRDLLLTATRDMLVLRGPAERLPWVDGAGYCAPAPGVPGLWLPTRLAPDLPAEPLHGALRERAGHASLLLWHAPELVLGLDDSLPVRFEVLDWLEGTFA